MILGVEHIALSSSDIEQDARLLEKAGYEVKFLEKDLPSNPAKQPFMRQHTPLHSVAYCRAAEGIAIELTQHAALLERGVSTYQVLFAGAPPDIIGVDAPAVRSEVLNAGFALDNASVAGVRGVLLSVKDLDVALKFWSEGLGCKVMERGDGWVKIAFRAPVAAWSLEIVLVEPLPPLHGEGEQSINASPSPLAGRGKLPMIDDAGFACLALITNRLEKDIEKSLANGATAAGDVFEFYVGGKKMLIAFVRGADGEPVELIEFTAKGS